MKYKGIELKAGVIVTPHNEGMSFSRYPDHVSVSEDETEFYLKSEADKVIAELKSDYEEACARLQTANLIKNEQLAATRHQKYKRCKAMSLYCESLMRDAFLANPEYVEWLEKWRGIWLELADKFKEAKCR